MTSEERLRYGLSALLAAGAMVAAAFVLAAPALPQWGERHLPHLQLPPLLLRSGQTAAQTVRWEASPLDTVVLRVDAEQPRPGDGGIALTIEAGGRTEEHAIAFADVPPSGITVFALPNPLPVEPGSLGTLRVRLTQPAQQVALSYQLDSSKYPEGELTQPNKSTQGDLAFQLRYRRPALGSAQAHRGAAALLVLAGLVTAAILRWSPGSRNEEKLSKNDLWCALACGAVVMACYSLVLLRPGLWVGAGDFSKDAAYLATAAAALKSGSWPTWSHLTCGGMAALGNPEGNTISLGTLLALVVPPDRALLALLAVEGALSAIGTYVLARALGASRAGSATAALIASLSASFAYRIVEGLTPVGGAVAFSPWVFLGLVQTLKTKTGWWVLLSGTALAAIFLRGDVHVIVGVGALVVLWLLLAALFARSRWPLIVLAGIGATSLLFGSMKILPYFEQPKLIGGELHPYVVPLARFGLLDDALFRQHDRSFAVKPLHDRRHEQWGNFGAYVGLLPVVLAGIGALSRRRDRVLLAALTLAAFALSEGALFESFLRHHEPFGILLRVPSRLFSLFALFLGILAAMGFDRIRRDVPHRLRVLFGALVLGFLVFDLGLATRRILLRNTEWSQATLPQPAREPLLVSHVNTAPNHERHATTLLRTGFLLPKICGDQNNPPPFVKQLKESLALATVPSRLEPNRVFLTVPKGVTDQVVFERFTTSWASAEASLLEHETGALRVISRRATPGELLLRVVSPTVRAQQILFGLFLATLGALALAFVPKTPKPSP